MSQPTEPTVVSDISTVLGVANIVIDGTPLWVSQGRTPIGRFWTLWTPEHLLAGTVTELADGSFNALTGRENNRAANAQDAALLIVAALHAENHTDGAK